MESLSRADAKTPKGPSGSSVASGPMTRRPGRTGDAARGRGDGIEGGTGSGSEAGSTAAMESRRRSSKSPSNTSRNRVANDGSSRKTDHPRFPSREAAKPESPKFSDPIQAAL